MPKKQPKKIIHPVDNEYDLSGHAFDPPPLLRVTFAYNDRMYQFSIQDLERITAQSDPVNPFTGHPFPPDDLYLMREIASRRPGYFDYTNDDPVSLIVKRDAPKRLVQLILSNPTKLCKEYNIDPSTIPPRVLPLVLSRIVASHDQGSALDPQ